MSKNEFSESSCNGSEFSSDPELCLNEKFSLFEEFSRLTSENSKGTFREFESTCDTEESTCDTEESTCDTEESNRSRSASFNSDSDISFNEEFSLCGDFSKITPFNIEPLESSSMNISLLKKELKILDSSSNKRLNNLNWCICNGGCGIMETELESICCQELNEITEEKIEGTL